LASSASTTPDPTAEDLADLKVEVPKGADTDHHELHRWMDAIMTRGHGSGSLQLLVGLLVAGIFILDCFTPLGYAECVLYLVPLLLTVWAGEKSYPIALAAICTVLVAIGFFVSPAGGSPIVDVIDRAMSATVVWVAAVLLVQRKRADEEIRRLNAELEARVRERTAHLRIALDDLEASRLEQLRMKDEFLSEVSHELRTPLAVIHQYATILADGLGGEISQRQRDFLEITLANISQLRTMIDSLLDVSQTQNGKLSVHPGHVSLAALIAEVLKSFQPAARANQLRLVTGVPDGLPSAFADAQRLRQIIANLIDNSIKFTPRLGTITVCAGLSDQDSRFLYITVADTGCGIDPNENDKVFERHYQVAGLVPASRKGLGLGLYICKELVTLHGGRIWIESQRGQGTTVSFTLPVFQADLEPATTLQHREL
jgi:signal transduction histidine kinase